MYLSPGTYTVSEAQQSGWAQTAPAGGSYTVSLANAQAVNNLDFGNQTNYCLTTNAVILNTGFNHPAGTTYGIGAADAFWTVVADPDPGTTEPRPATVITKNPAWSDPQASSQWISSYATPDDDLNGAYDFQTQFCLQTNYSNVVLSLCLRADDWADVYLNGTLILTTPDPSFNASPACTNLNSTARPDLFHGGANLLLVRVHNQFGVAMGLNLTGTV